MTLLDQVTARWLTMNPQREGRKPPFTETELALIDVLQHETLVIRKCPACEGNGVPHYSALRARKGKGAE